MGQKNKMGKKKKNGTKNKIEPKKEIEQKKKKKNTFLIFLPLDSSSDSLESPPCKCSSGTFIFFKASLKVFSHQLSFHLKPSFFSVPNYANKISPKI